MNLLHPQLIVDIAPKHLSSEAWGQAIVEASVFEL